MTIVGGGTYSNLFIPIPTVCTLCVRVQTCKGSHKNNKRENLKARTIILNGHLSNSNNDFVHNSNQQNAKANNYEAQGCRKRANLP
jgi:hypothetical protein